MSFVTAAARVDAVEKAGNILGTLRTIYIQAKNLKTLKALYVAGSDPVFNAAFEAVFNVAGDRTELAAMIGQLETLIADWEVNHAAAVGV